MVCNVTTFSYNRGTPGGALYLGNIGSPKDRCVSDTCDFFFFRPMADGRICQDGCIRDSAD